MMINIEALVIGVAVILVMKDIVTSSGVRPEIKGVMAAGAFGILMAAISN